MKKKWLTLKDLATFCENNQLNHFASKEHNDEVIVVQAPGTFSLSEGGSDGLKPVTLKACHDMTNVNGSHITKEDMETALPSFQLKPILANIITKNDGTVDFGAHDMEIITNPFDAEEEMIHYIETPVGIVFGDSKLVYDEEAEVDRVVVNGYLYEDYGNMAIKVLEARGGSSAVSVEICIKEMSYNAKDKVLNITDFYFDGVTLLGEDVKPGMVGSEITLKDFSKENNSLFNMIERLDKIEKILSDFNIEKSEEGGKDSVKLEELLAKYEITAEELTFEVEGLSDEELEAKFAEAFETEEGTEETETPDDTEEVDSTTTEEEACGTKKKKKCSLNEDGTMSVTFEVSHEDIRYSLYSLLYSIEENDDEYYYINAVYDGYFVYSTWDETKIFKHAYTVDGDNVSIADERTQLFKEYLTTSEKATLDEMRSNYSILQNKVNEFEAAASRQGKLDVLNDEAYAEMEANAFEELVKDVDKYTLEEFKDKADLIFAKHEKSKKKKSIGFSYSDHEEEKPYGNLFN